MEEQPLQPEAVLAQLVQENQSLRAEMQHLRARFDAANLAVATQSATNDQGSNSSRLARDPKPFSGQRDVVEPFLDHVRLVLQIRPQRFRSEKEKTLYAASFFEGAAFSWFQPLLRDDPKGILHDFEAFAEQLTRTFGDSFLQENADDRLHELRQTTSVAAFASEFRRLAAHVKINEAGLVSMFRRALKPHIQDELAKITESFTEVAKLSEVAIRIDQRISGRQQARRGLDPRHDQSRRVFTRPVVETVIARPVADQSVPMEIGSAAKFKPLTEEEKNRRRRDGLCMYCGGKGHVALRCPNKRPTHRAAATSFAIELSDVADTASPKNV